MLLCSVTPLFCCPCVPHVDASTCLTRMLCCSRRYFFVSGHCIRSGLKFVCYIAVISYQSLDEGQREMLKEHGLVVNIVNS